MQHICQRRLSPPGQLNQLGGQARADPSPVLRQISAQLTCSHALLHARAVLEHNAMMGRFHQLKEKTLGSCICVAHS